MEAADKNAPALTLLERAKARFKEADELSRDNRKHWLEDAKFRVVGHGNQWPENIKRQRDKDGLPCLEVDKLNQYLRQVVNDGRQNRPGIKVRPVDDGGDEKVAEAFQGIIRSISNRSNLDEALDTALDHAATGGFGYIRVLTDYAHERTFNQEIVIRRVRNPLAVRLGPHYLADGSDAEYGFFVDEVEKDAFKRKWPKAKQTDWNTDDYGDGWSTKTHVLVCEHFYKEPAPVALLLLDDGTVCTADEYRKKLDNVRPGERVPAIEEEREIPSSKVKWCRMTGAEVLEENDWQGKYIPIVPVYGNEFDLAGKVSYSGLVRGGMDAQRLHNYMRSKFAERVALTPMAPWLIAEGQIEGHEEDWQDQSVGGKPVLVYKETSLDGRQVPPPQRISPSDVPAGFAQDMQMSEHDIQASMGMYAASLGQASNEKSGKAIMARQREGDTATFHYQDNLNRAIRYLGRILVDLIPKVYDSRRVVRLLGEDGKQSQATIDPDMAEPFREDGSSMIYNLGVGHYDVEVEAGPSYTTKRQESAEAMVQLVQANPAMWQTHGDLIVKAQDWPNADAFARRSRMTLPPELREADEGDENPDVREARMLADQIRADAEREIGMREQALEQASQKIADLERELQSREAEAAAKLQDADTREYQAHTERIQAFAPAITPEMIQQIAQATAEAVLTRVVQTDQQPPPPMVEAPLEPPPGGFFTP